MSDMSESDLAGACHRVAIVRRRLQNESVGEVEVLEEGVIEHICTVADPGADCEAWGCSCGCIVRDGD